MTQRDPITCGVLLLNASLVKWAASTAESCTHQRRARSTSEPSKAQGGGKVQLGRTGCWVTWGSPSSLGFVDKVITWIGSGCDVLTLSGLQRVVLLPIIVGVKELLEPLNKFKVVLELSFYQLLHRDYLQELRGENVRMFW